LVGQIRNLHLGVALTGVGTTQNEWRHPDVPGDASVNIDWFVAEARRAEAAKLDFVFIVDSPYITPDTAPHFLNRLEPLTLLSAVAVATSRIGLAATLTTSYWEPFNVARQFASLDLISRGRAGWNVVTTGLEGAAGNYGREAHFDHQVRYRRALEFVQVVQGLWDSYEDDAFPRDKASGVFLDKSRQHRLDHRGEFFSVAGPLNIQRSIQGQPVIFQAGDSDEGRNLAAGIADATFVAAGDFDQALAYRQDVRARIAARGRDPELFRALPGLRVIIEDTDAAAEEREAAQRANLDFRKSLIELGRAFNYHDFTAYDPDAPFPDVSVLSLNSYKGMAERIVRLARDENLTLRQTVDRFFNQRSRFVGSPRTVADEIARWFEAGAADGFILHIANPDDFKRFTGAVVPLLQERGLFRADYTSSTLRGHLGLPVPQNRHAAARSRAAAAE
jgi:FMN-dependent oxidoreductase (nitrilotriacetate monooxygenase family)